jgi:hypothetical protein
MFMSETTGNRIEMAADYFAIAHRWHGSIEDQYSNIDNLVTLARSHQSTWAMPQGMLTQLLTNRSEALDLIIKCRTPAASTFDRGKRNVLLKSTVGLCLNQVKLWAYGQYVANVMTAEDIHELGFLLPGENGGRRERTEATDITAEVKVTIINEDYVRVVIDQSAGENAAKVVHGWPAGVRNALIVISSTSNAAEVVRQITTHLYTDIKMPEGSHGKQFVVKAAFLKHVDDDPRFGNEPTFSMPLTTEDLIKTMDRQHHEEFEAHIREVEHHRLEIERLEAAMNAKK